MCVKILIDSQLITLTMAHIKNILVVEDVEFDRDLLIQLLEDQYQVITAENGAEAIEHAQQVMPELILMDLSLPVVDGWEATRRIIANPLLIRISVIALSVHAMLGDAEKGLASGCVNTSPNRSMRCGCLTSSGEITVSNGR